MNFTLFSVIYSCVDVDSRFTTGTWPIYAFCASEAKKKARKEIKSTGATRVRIKDVKVSEVKSWIGFSGIALTRPI